MRVLPRENIHEPDIFENGAYVGFFRPDTIEEYFEEYREWADKKAENVMCDDIVLYAVFEYDPDSQKILNIHFTNIVLPYDDYLLLIKLVSGERRYFFYRGRECYL